MSRSQNSTEAQDECWNEELLLKWVLADGSPTDEQFEDAMAVTTPYSSSSDEMQVGPNPTSFNTDWILMPDEVEK